MKFSQNRFIFVVIFSFFFTLILAFKLPYHKELQILDKEITDLTVQKNLQDPYIKQELILLISNNLINFSVSKIEAKTLSFKGIQKDYKYDKNFFTKKYKSIVDLDTSSNQELMKNLIQKKILIATERAMDMAAGDGRITQSVLSKYFDEIDIVEPVDDLIPVLKKLKLRLPKIKDIYHMKAEDFQFKKQYDLIWSGWFLCHLTDINVLKYLIKARDSLKDEGIIVIKENANKKTAVDYAKPQKIRPLKVFEFFSKLVGLNIIYKGKVKGYPTHYYPVYEIVVKNK